MARKATPANLLDELMPTTSETTVLRSGLRWDYSQAGDAADEVQRHAVEIKRSERRASEAIIEAGEHLLAVKGLLAHGQWLDWLGVEFGMSDRTAQRMMSVAEQFAGKSDTVSNLSTTVLYLLAADSTPEPARAAVLEQAASGETVTKAQAQATIDAHKPRVYESGLPVLDIRMPSQTRYIPQKRRAELLRAGYSIAYNPKPPYGDGMGVARWQGQPIGRFADGDAAWLAIDEHAKTQAESASKAQTADLLDDIEVGECVRRAIMQKYFKPLNQREADRIAEDMRQAAQEKDGKTWRAVCALPASADQIADSLLKLANEVEIGFRGWIPSAQPAVHDAVQRSVDATVAYREATQVVLVQPARLREFQVAFEGSMSTLADWALECGHQVEASAAARAIRACIELIEKDLAE